MSLLANIPTIDPAEAARTFGDLIGTEDPQIFLLGLGAGWPSWLLTAMMVPAVAMSIFLGRSLIVNGHECRICWTGHFSNFALFALLLARSIGGA